MATVQLAPASRGFRQPRFRVLGKGLVEVLKGIWISVSLTLNYGANVEAIRVHRRVEFREFAPVGRVPLLFLPPGW